MTPSALASAQCAVLPCPFVKDLVLTGLWWRLCGVVAAGRTARGSGGVWGPRALCKKLFYFLQHCTTCPARLGADVPVAPSGTSPGCWHHDTKAPPYTTNSLHQSSVSTISIPNG